MTWTLSTILPGHTAATEAPFTNDQAADRLVKRRVAKDRAAALAMLAAGKPIVLPANGGTPEQTLTPVKEAKSGSVP